MERSWLQKWMKMNNVYVIFASSGEWDSYSTRNVCAFLVREKSIQFLDKLFYFLDDENLYQDELKKLDPKFTLGVDMSYHMEEITLIEDNV